MSTRGGILGCIRRAVIEPTDSPELRLKKTFFVFATALISAAALLWLAIYWQLGPQVSATIPIFFLLLLWGNFAVYLKTRNLAHFQNIQLSLILIMPFVAQWRMGSFVSASGISLWSLLAPIGATLLIGIRESTRWFIAYIALTALSGAFEFFFSDASDPPRYLVPAQTTAFFFALNFAAVSTIVFLLLRHSSLEIQKAQARQEAANVRLQIEQDRSERLLLNILPASISARLKNSNQTIADGFADVSVMFADIVNFTKVADGMNPRQVFAMLNRIFSSFDELAEKHGLEKIKTIGDAYMVAGGLNERCHDYTTAIVNMAIDMKELLHTDANVNHMHLEIRIGIGTGPVVAGVVGKKKFIYDLWGDTVNIASRITSEGLPGTILVDDETYHRLHQRFQFSEPQSLRLKGKGRMTVHQVIGRIGANVESLPDI